MRQIRGPLPDFSAETEYLAHPALQRLLGHMLLDPELGARFLNGGRVEILSRADYLSDQERALLSSVQANTAQELAKALVRFFQTGQLGFAEV